MKSYTRPEEDVCIKKAIDADAQKDVTPVERLVTKLDWLNKADKAAKVQDTLHRRRMGESPSSASTSNVEADKE